MDEKEESNKSYKRLIDINDLIKWTSSCYGYNWWKLIIIPILISTMFSIIFLVTCNRTIFISPCLVSNKTIIYQGIKET